MNRETRKMNNRAEARNVCSRKEMVEGGTIHNTSFTYRRETRLRKIVRGLLNMKVQAKYTMK
jgi:hypothetical protein